MLLDWALLVCDRTELRDNGLGDFKALFGNDVAEIATASELRTALETKLATLDCLPAALLRQVFGEAVGRC